MTDLCELVVGILHDKRTVDLKEENDDLRCQSAILQHQNDNLRNQNDDLKGKMMGLVSGLGNLLRHIVGLEEAALDLETLGVAEAGRQLDVQVADNDVEAMRPAGLMKNRLTNLHSFKAQRLLPSKMCSMENLELRFDRLMKTLDA